MKHARIAAVVAGLFALPTLSFADTNNVTVYGIAQAAVSFTNNGSVKQTIIEDTGSRIGFKGEEDLGGGMAAFFKIESGVALDDARKSGFATREGWVGLKGKDWGAVKLGRGKTYFDLAQESFDGFNGNSTMINSLLVDNAYYRINNSIAYESPDMSGFTAKFEYGDIEKKAPGVNPYTFIGVAEYNNGPIYAVAGFEKQHQQELGQAGTSQKSACSSCSATNTILGGGYTFASDTNLKLAWRHSKASDAGLSGKRNAFIAVVTQPIGQFAVRAGYMHRGNVSGNADVGDTGGNYWALGGEYDLSKRTILYTEYTRASNGTKAGPQPIGQPGSAKPYYDLLGTTVGQSTAAGASRSNSAWTTGLIHVF